MKTLIALVLITASQVVPAADKAASPEAKFLTELGNTSSYIVAREDAGMRISVFGNDADPRKVCELADKYPTITVNLVKNPMTNVTAYCTL